MVRRELVFTTGMHLAVYLLAAHFQMLWQPCAFPCRAMCTDRSWSHSHGRPRMLTAPNGCICSQLLH